MTISDLEQRGKTDAPIKAGTSFWHPTSESVKWTGSSVMMGVRQSGGERLLQAIDTCYVAFMGSDDAV